MSETEPTGLDFVRRIIEEDLMKEKWGGRVATRFPPEPNGYLHIGHAKSICLNFGIAEEYKGTCNLRYDDTNPVMYRILHEKHHNTGDKWCIYPMYDWAHGLEDSLEKITHSICTLEFENHRPLYDWFLKELGVYHPQQIEFARLNLTYTMLSKRKLLEMVKCGVVKGWDDPRMTTISGFRRRGYTPEAIRAFCTHIGVNKFDSRVDVQLLESFLR